jgi:hypothetical protein
LRPLPYLHYRQRRPTAIDSTFVVPPGVTWILLEGESSQLVFAPPATETELPVRALPLAPNLHAFAVGRRRVDAWFTPTSPEAGEAPPKLHLWREGLLDDPEVFERAAADP